MNKLLATVFVTLAPAAVFAADIDAGRERAAVCTACHGANGVAVSPDIPNLAAQNVKYLDTQLKAFRSGSRKNAMMNAMAAPLSDDDIANVAAFFNSLTPGTQSESSPVGRALDQIELAFPSDYKQAFRRYSIVDQAGPKRVRYNFVNRAGLSGLDANGMAADGTFILTEVYAAKLDGAGKPVTGADGHYVPGKFLTIAAMEKRAGRGSVVPESLRNGDWLYALFTPEGKPKKTAQAKCLACHKSLHDADYLFSYDALKKAN
jgi:cytochrome c553